MARKSKNPRPLVATLFSNRKPVWVRYYARLDTAVRKSVHLAVLEGEPGDVIEFSSRQFGYQIGTVVIHVLGRLTVSWDKQFLTEALKASEELSK